VRAGAFLTCFALRGLGPSSANQNQPRSHSFIPPNLSCSDNKHLSAPQPLLHTHNSPPTPISHTCARDRRSIRESPSRHRRVGLVPTVKRRAALRGGLWTQFRFPARENHHGTKAAARVPPGHFCGCGVCAGCRERYVGFGCVFSAHRGMRRCSTPTMRAASYMTVYLYKANNCNSNTPYYLLPPILHLHLTAHSRLARSDPPRYRRC
jgi:hypothetical protein